jgi:hypothetical protein
MIFEKSIKVSLSILNKENPDKDLKLAGNKGTKAY